MVKRSPPKKGRGLCRKNKKNWRGKSKFFFFDKRRIGAAWLFPAGPRGGWA